MKNLRFVVGLWVGWIATSVASELPAGFAFERGALNAVNLERNGRSIQFYGAKRATTADMVLLTHVRRDLAVFASQMTKKVVSPKASMSLLTEPESVWSAWWEERFNYYGQQVTKWPTMALKPVQGVDDGEVISWQDLKIKVVAIPGYTRDMVAYVMDVGGKRVVVCGDLIWEGGRVFDFYSFQDPIPEAKIGAYHGYGGKLASWISSLDKIAALKPDILIPARGPLLNHPTEDLRLAKERAQAIYRNYQSTNALHWYFGEERLTTAGRRVLGDDAQIELMPFAQHIELPEWCHHLGTTKLLVAEDKSGFVLDVGGKKALSELTRFLSEGLITSIDGIWVTHCHNDHSAYVGEAQQQFGCPVYATAEVADVVEKPGNWFLPGLSMNVVEEVQVMEEQETIRWKDFELTGSFFPGQMYNHGALLVEKPDHDPVFFIGDSFSPSGIDDYCLMNRNLMGDDTGYLYCLDVVRSLSPTTWLVNQHIPHRFRFNGEELDNLEDRYRERRRLFAEFLPWDHVDYGVDEQWAWFYPYGTEANPGETVFLDLKIRNHSKRDRTFFVTFHQGDNIVARDAVWIEGRTEGRAELSLKLDPDLESGIHVVTASILSRDLQVEHWSEALIKVSDEKFIRLPEIGG
ncbi:MAG: MBL fold metallo-hydrolase [Verrucomicrobiota bacterium]